MKEDLMDIIIVVLLVACVFSSSMGVYHAIKAKKAAEKSLALWDLFDKATKDSGMQQQKK